MAKKYSTVNEWIEYNSRVKICPVCNTEFIKSYAKNVCSEFCSKHCAKRASTIRKNPLRQNKRKLKELEYNKNPKHCLICNEIISYEFKHRKTCGKHNCIEALKLKSMIENGTHPKDRNTKFVENGQGRSKSGRYKGFFCNSTYELAYYIYCIDHDISIERNTKKYKYVYNGKEHYYIPDFRVNDKLTEIKGYCNEQVKAKLAAVNDEPIDILYIEDLQPMMDYVDATYGCKHTGSRNNYTILYDDYKPSYKYKYICECCKKEFETNAYRNIKKYKHIFCSNKCCNNYKRLHVEEYYNEYSITRNLLKNKINSDEIRIIPNCSKYAADRSGRAYSLFSGKELKLNICKLNAKPRYTLRDDNTGKSKAFFPEQLIELCFNNQ